MTGRHRIILVAALVSFIALANPTRADDPARAGALAIKEGNRLLDEGKYGEALAAYDKARELLPDLPEAAYNRGVALYRFGRYADAEKTFQDALRHTTPELEAKAKYNLGRCSHASAIQNKDKTEAAINDLTKAIGFYNDALQIMPNDKEASENKELAEGLRDYLKKVLEQQQQEKKQSSSQPSSQPNDEPTSQPDKQPSSQPSENKEGQDDESKDEQQSDEQKSKDQKNQSKKKGDKQDKAENSGDQNQSNEGESEEGSQDQQDQEMSESQASAMLQEARDMEHNRREAKRARLLRMRGRIPVDKDW
jgi:tetratricopeptide (TPR) repeat protein